ncbi:unnamed protein product [Linum tenue]|uniref:Poor homologous synapsis 1 PH domain-containing protein n=1 Tax=Linum tenue TaxID=586396 RepID=A0AAV0HYY4_9ROSI|nr:unnamed protein product [Linum tenue]
MAGSMAVVLHQSEEAERSDSFVPGERWQVSFARFLHFPTILGSLHPCLVQVKRHAANPGTWISSSSPTATLQLVYDDSCSDAILSVYLQGRLVEEHYVSKLYFSWPQVCCVNGYPSRGTRAVFASFKDSAGLIQKFALQFLTTSESETFIGCLKDILEDPPSAATEPSISDLRPESSTHSAGLSTAMPVSRDCMEESSAMSLSPTYTYSPELPLNITNAAEDPILSENSNNNASSSTFMPPSFTSLLSNCCSETKQAAGDTNVADADGDLKSQIAKYMEDSSFQDMLFKVGKVIGEIGYDLVL